MYYCSSMFRIQLQRDFLRTREKKKMPEDVVHVTTIIPCVFFDKAAQHNMWMGYKVSEKKKKKKDSTPWSHIVIMQPHMAVVGALTMEGHESRRAKQLKFCGNINIKSRAERTGSDGCLLRHRERKKCGHWHELTTLVELHIWTFKKKKKEVVLCGLGARLPLPHLTDRLITKTQQKKTPTF